MEVIMLDSPYIHCRLDDDILLSDYLAARKLWKRVEEINLSSAQMQILHDYLACAASVCASSAGILGELEPSQFRFPS